MLAPCGYREQITVGLDTASVRLAQIRREIEEADAEVRAAIHRFLADEPESIGGFDAGPGPYDFLATALGACTSMTLRLYANHKGLALDDVTVDLRHDRLHADDCAGCAQTPHRIERIRRDIRLTGDLSAEQRRRLLEIADRCPVHRTLEGELRIETTLKE